eukprot:304938_1
MADEKKSNGGSSNWWGMSGVTGGVVGCSVLALTSIAVAPALIGFGVGGVAAGSIAAGIQSGIGNVAAGSIFATMQSVGVLGFGAATKVGITGAGAALGAKIGEYCSTQTVQESSGMIEN